MRVTAVLPKPRTPSGSKSIWLISPRLESGRSALLASPSYLVHQRTVASAPMGAGWAVGEPTTSAVL